MCPAAPGARPALSRARTRPRGASGAFAQETKMSERAFSTTALSDAGGRAASPTTMTAGAPSPERCTARSSEPSGLQHGLLPRERAAAHERGGRLRRPPGRLQVTLEAAEAARAHQDDERVRVRHRRVRLAVFAARVRGHDGERGRPSPLGDEQARGRGHGQRGAHAGHHLVRHSRVAQRGHLFRETSEQRRTPALQAHHRAARARPARSSGDGSRPAEPVRRGRPCRRPLARPPRGRTRGSRDRPAGRGGRRRTCG